MSDRRRRQAQQKKLHEVKKEAQAKREQRELEVQGAQDRVESAQYWNDKTENYLDRVRNGYAEGSKLFFESFKTRATLTTGSIVVIAALSEAVLPVNEGYKFLIWLSYGSLLLSMLAALTTLDRLTVGVYMTLTNEDDPSQLRTEEGRERAHEKAEALKEQSNENSARLARRSKLAAWTFYAGIGLFLLFLVLPPLVGTIGVAWAIVSLLVFSSIFGVLSWKL